MKSITLRALASLLSILFISFISLSSFAQSGISEGIDLFEQGNLTEAKAYFQNVLKSDKQNAPANFYLGRIYFDEEDFEEAADWFEKATKYEKRNSTYHMWIGHAYGRRAQNAGKLKQAFYARDSRNGYEKAIELDPDNVEARESALEFYLQAPGFMGGGRDKAEEQATMIAKLDGIAGFTAWGRIYSYYDEPESTYENYINALEVYPEEMTFYYRLFSYHFGKEEFDKAIEITKRQLVLNDTTATIYYNLGNAFQWSDQFEEALDSYKKSLEIDSAYYSSLYQIGRLAAVSNSYLDEGEESLIKFIEKKDTYNNSTLAWTYFRLGTIYENRGSIEAAKDQYQQALKSDKDHAESKQALKRLN